jgi:hypothetical protein
MCFLIKIETVSRYTSHTSSTLTQNINENTTMFVYSANHVVWLLSDMYNIDYYSAIDYITDIYGDGLDDLSMCVVESIVYSVCEEFGLMSSYAIRYIRLCAENDWEYPSTKPKPIF